MARAAGVRKLLELVVHQVVAWVAAPEIRVLSAAHRKAFLCFVYGAAGVHRITFPLTEPGWECPRGMLADTRWSYTVVNELCRVPTMHAASKGYDLYRLPVDE